MTEQQALTKTLIIWRYISRHPHITKVEAYHVLDLSRDFSDCPLCAYTRTEENNYTCLDCPLLDLWPEPRQCVAPCCHDDSPYIRWARDRQSEDATLIAEAARKKLKELTYYD